MKAALVTGGAHRLGRAFSLGLGRAGWAVAVHYRSRREEAAETVRLLRDGGSDAEAFEADLAGSGAPRRLVEAAAARFGRLDALVHSASPWVEGAVADVTEADWDAVFGTGPKAAFFLAQAAAPYLAAARGVLLLVSDVAAEQAWPRHVPHAAAKAAVNALVRNLALALAPEVRVNGLAPGIVLPPENLAPGDVAALVGRTPLRRQVAVEDVVSAALGLLTNGSITGQVLAVDAGRSVV